MCLIKKPYVRACENIKKYEQQKPTKKNNKKLTIGLIFNLLTPIYREKNSTLERDFSVKTTGVVNEMIREMRY